MAQRLSDLDQDDSAVKSLSQDSPVFGPSLPQNHWTLDEPLFLNSLPEDMEGNSAISALQALQEEYTPEERAENYKDQGNELFRLGTHRYRDAIKMYTNAILEGINDNEKNSIYYSNRAFVNLKLENYGKVIEDCQQALELHPTNLKATLRASSASFALKKYQQAIDYCDLGLKVKKEKSLIELRKEASQKLKELEEIERKKREEVERKQQKINLFKAALNSRGYIKGKSLPMNSGQFQGSISWAEDNPLSDELTFPILFLYPEYEQSDFVKDCSERSSFQSHLQMMFPSPNSAPWDQNGDYVFPKLCLYLQTNQTDIEGSDEPNYRKKEWVRINPRKTIGDAIRTPGYILSGDIGVFYVFVDNSFLREFLAK